MVVQDELVDNDTGSLRLKDRAARVPRNSKSTIKEREGKGGRDGGRKGR